MTIPQRTIKLVIIGAASVGKTSIRGQYISQRFSTGYRATIGADFISKIVEINEGETVTLQIWDTAGQERFSSLSSAFFRGADAALLVFDVNAPETLESLRKWWEEFKNYAPLKEDAQIAKFCVVIVGNKVDLAKGKSGPVSFEQARAAMNLLVPLELYTGEEITAKPNQTHSLYASSSVSGLSIYHTPSSSIDFPSASPELSHSLPPLTTGSVASLGSFSPGNTSAVTLTPNNWDQFDREDARVSSSGGRLRFDSVASSVSAAESFFSAHSTFSPRSHLSRPASPLLSRPHSSSPLKSLSSSSSSKPEPDSGPRLFFASAKTGKGVQEVFEYVAKRVVQRWKWEAENEEEGEEGEEDELINGPEDRKKRSRLQMQDGSTYLGHNGNMSNGEGYRLNGHGHDLPSGRGRSLSESVTITLSNLNGAVNSIRGSGGGGAASCCSA